MAENRQLSKLAVILHADVAGSTTLVQQDEHLAHERIQETFHRFGDTITKYHGHVCELRGDALLAEFERASDAVTAALAFQADHADHNARLNDNIRPTLRVGIAMGEVIIADNTVTGEGVVLAQRVEQLAEPGRLCITGAIHEALPQRMPFDQEDLGEQALKGFDEPVHIYRVALSPGESIPPPQESRQLEALPKRRGLIVAVAAIALVVAGGAAYWFKPWAPQEAPASVEHMAFPLPDKPSIAVLPFANMSDDPKQEYFADGMTEDLITDLSKISGLFTIARNSVFTYKGKPVKVQQVAEELGVRYVLEGSVRRAGEKVRINAQLIDATTGGHLWAERYDGSLTDVFALQDNVTEKIVAALKVSLTAEEQRLKERNETDNPEAYDAFLEGWTRYRLYTPEDFAKAIPSLKKAIKLDPNYGRAHAALAAVYTESWWNAWIDVVKGWRINKLRAREHLEAAMKNPTPLAHRIASLWLIRDGRHDEAIAEAERALALNPNEPNGHGAMARALILAGRPGESLEFINKAIRLDPRSNYQFWLGVAQFHMEQYDEAVATMRKYTQRIASVYEPHLYLAAAHGHLGRDSEARAAFETLNEIRERVYEQNRPFVLENLKQLRYKQRAETERLREGLAKAGIGSEIETVAASSDGITLKKALMGSADRVFATAAEHCRQHGKHANLKSTSPPIYVFSCS